MHEAHPRAPMNRATRMHLHRRCPAPNPGRGLPIRTRISSISTLACSSSPTGWVGTTPARWRRELAVDAVVEFIRATHDSRDITWPFPVDPTQSLAVEPRSTVALRIANRDGARRRARAIPRMRAWARRSSPCWSTAIESSLGTSATAAPTSCATGELRQMTEDDTWVNAMLGAGAAAERADHPMRHVLTSGIGMGADVVAVR